MATRLSIVRGPGQHVLSGHFSHKGLREEPLEFEAGPCGEWSADKFYRCRQSFSPELTGGSPMTFSFYVRLNLLEWEDGSGHNWNFTGWLLRAAAKDTRVRGFYSTKTGKGWIVFETVEEVERREYIQAAMKLAKRMSVDEHHKDLGLASQLALWLGENFGWSFDEQRKAERDGLL